MMWPIIWKSTVIALLMLVSYRALLEKTSLHKFKRIFLLMGLVLSILVPFIIIPVYSNLPEHVAQQTGKMPEVIVDTAAYGVAFNWEILILSVYMVGMFLFLTRFVMRILKIRKYIRQGEKVRKDHYTLILLDDEHAPQSFFNFIFLNKKDYKGHNLPDAVIEHETAHVSQGHSWDLMFSEIMTVLLWFNPVIFQYTKYIKLNHEFLADQEVLKRGIPLAEYQQLIFSYLRSGNASDLVHSFNYSFIQKRFKVMNIKTSKFGKKIRYIGCVLLVSFVVYGFSDRNVIFQKQESSGVIVESASEYSLQSVKDQYLKKLNAYNTILKDGKTFINRSRGEQQELINLYADLQQMYSYLLKKGEKGIVAPELPNEGYFKLVDDNNVYYKSEEDLTDADKSLLEVQNIKPQIIEVVEDQGKKQEVIEVVEDQEVIEVVEVVGFPYNEQTKPYLDARNAVEQYMSSKGGYPEGVKNLTEEEHREVGVLLKKMISEFIKLDVDMQKVVPKPFPPLPPQVKN
ncbi:M56 family metallopeptidase [Robertkochia solimangrovi]|uniref:M56 family metallopeptidase n=1 Tax=Robertkochia solimangrovi TaxID=2213046 RepID=UPI00117DB5F6|nr:hypothetical protein [Robertkochia solimangrovi]TRZ41191.1 hypothetical protein DMZ48_18130 [Robertkochia solimangrovi]